MKREHKLKVLAFLISATLWYLVVWGKPIEKTLEIPIKYKNSYSKDFFVEINPSTISVKITATRSQLRNLEKDKLEIEIDLEKYSPGAHQIRIPIEKINLPSSIKVKEISPVYLTLVIKKFSQKKVPVKLSLIEDQKQRYQTMRVMLKPSMVSIKGFWEEIKEIEEVYTEAIDPDTLRENKVLEVKLKTPPKVIEVHPNSVKIIYLYP
ncbi:MAG: CdaR family protein [Caldimicrobium sp.]|nr:CdaR family protein [Caldimicrobium sp.]MCX7872839.1 CdaR family protein [Caldimicrobium sp.]MDW8093582.1 CdaR family protein [Caldimicrobium sp.]